MDKGLLEADTDDIVYSRVGWHALPGVRTGNQLTRGEKWADAVRNRMGSWGFVGGFIAVMVVWAGTNTFALADHAFDPYPYILLNLMLSTLAGLQGAILLIAAKRADAIASEQAFSHMNISRSSSEILDKMQGDLDKNTTITEMVRDLSGEIHSLLLAMGQDKGND